MAKNIVIGQKVEKEKIQRAKELRRRMTAEEEILWRHLRTNRLQGLHFRRQQVIDGFIVDFYCHQSGLVIEIDGESHRSRKDYDALREKALAGYALRVIRFKDRELREDLEKVLLQIAEACGSSLPLPASGRGPGG